MQTYYYVLASQSLEEEEEFWESAPVTITNGKEIDFWLVNNLPSWKHLKWQRLKLNAQPSAAVISNPEFITWLKLRLEQYYRKFQAPADDSRPLSVVKVKMS